MSETTDPRDQEAIDAGLHKLSEWIGYENRTTAPEQDRLRKRFKAMGVVQAHATWGPNAGDREDRAAVINAALDQIENGDFEDDVTDAE
jgi:hypothetical protein